MRSVTEASGLSILISPAQAKLCSGPKLWHREGPLTGERNVLAQGGGGRPAWHQTLFAHPRKEEINIDTRLLRHSLGKPAPEPRLRPCPSLTLSCLPTLCQLPGLPRLLPGLPTWQLGDSPSYPLSLVMEQKLQLQPGENWVFLAESSQDL